MNNIKAIFTILKRISSPLQEDCAPTLSNRVVENFKTSKQDPKNFVTSCRLLKQYVEETYDAETAEILFDKLEEHKHIPPAINKHDISTVEGFMNAVDEVMQEMVSGAAIGGAFDGAQSNANTNASGMAAPNGASKKKKNKLDAVLLSRFR